MIVANEFNFVEAMRDEGINIEIIKKLRRRFQGWRVYFRAKKSEYVDIKDDYCEMLANGYSKADSIGILSEYYEKSEVRIKEIVAKQGEFDFEV